MCHFKLGKKHFRIFIFILIILFPPILFSQNQNEIDSLNNLLRKDKEDTVKLTRLNQISLLCAYAELYDSSRHYADEAINLANKFPENEILTHLANAYNNIGISYFFQGVYKISLEYYLKALKIDKRQNNENSIAIRMGNIGNIYLELGDYNKALDYYFNSVKIHEKLGNKNKLASQFGNIGILYDNLLYHQKALEYYNKALKIDEELNNKDGIASDLCNIGVTYKEIGQEYKNKGDTAKALPQYNIALEYYFKALRIDEEIGNKSGVGADLGNIGSLYYSLHDNDKAMEYFLKALKIFESLENKRAMAIWLGNIGNLLIELGNISQGEKYLINSLQLDSSIGSVRGVMYKHESLSELYEKNKQYPKSLYHFKQAMILKDSLFNEEKNNDITRKEMNFEFEKKEAVTKAEHDKQIAIADAESKKQRLFILFIAAVAIAVAVIAFIIFRSLKITKKQKHIIELQKNEVEHQKEIVEGQKEEIVHKNKELTDSINYAQRIQSAILTSEQYLNDMFLPQEQIASHFILYKPKDIVAGDFYWAYKTKNGKAIWVAADCTGHGVPGAFMSMIGNSLLNEIVVEKKVEEPDEILNQLRAGIIKSLGQGVKEDDKRKDGMDASLCCWDKMNNKFSFAGANNSLWILRKESPLPNGDGVGVGLMEIEPDIQPVGHHLVMNSFTKKEIQLQKGDTLYTFTDGFCDQFGGPKGKKFKYKPFKELLLSIQEKTMPEQREILSNTIDEWKGSLEQVDDICVFGVRI